nr:cytochrome b5 [Cryptococcus depauperatus CBS 7841]ODN98617.1 cytochrome b5 [Cryptococcus depauperatus CBS 7855]
MAETAASPSAAPQEGEEKLYTLEMLAQHNTKESLWMLLHNKHPGGDEVLLEEAGRDATEAFEDVGHSDEARKMLPKMFLGEFQGGNNNQGKPFSPAGFSSGSSPSGQVLQHSQPGPSRSLFSLLI